MFANYYKKLDLLDNAPEDEIKKAYKKLAIKWHPDKQNGKTDEEKKEAEEKFKEIAEAYEILTNKEKYANKTFAQGNRQGFVNPHDIFNQIFRDMHINNGAPFNMGARGVGIGIGLGNISINIPRTMQATSVMRTSNVSIQNGKRVETIRETINGQTRQRVIVSDLTSKIVN
jgi:DnaJ-class molecular chaperone